MGTSIAYHLTKLGVEDVLLLEQGSIGGGTTWHAAGLVGTIRNTLAETRLSRYASELIPRLEQDTGLGTGWRQCGSITLARCKDRDTVLRRTLSRGQAFGMTGEMLTPSEAAERYPVDMRIDDLVSALWLPGDGIVTPGDFCSALAKGAKMHGAQMVEKVHLNAVVTNHGRVVGVNTDAGYVKCDVFVNCAGLWAREVGFKCQPQVNVPLHAAEHFYVITKPINGCEPNLPVMRDPDGHTYFREWSGGLVAGGFEKKCKPCFHDGAPERFEYSLLEEDWDHFAQLMDEILWRVPSMKDTEIRQMINGPESFTSDGHYLFGEVPEVCDIFCIF